MCTALVAVALLGAPLSARAEGADAQDAEASREVGRVLAQALDAKRTDRLQLAYDLARQVLALDSGPSTFAARAIVFDYLEAEGRWHALAGEATAASQLDGLLPVEVERAARARATAEEELATVAALARRRVGWGVAIAGAVTLGAGIASLGQGDHIRRRYPSTYAQGWFALGGAAAGIGATTAGAGLAAALAPLPAGRGVRGQLGAGLEPGAFGPRVLVWGTF